MKMCTLFFVCFIFDNLFIPKNPTKQANDRSGLGLETASAVFFYKVAEAVCIVSQCFFGNHVSAEAIPEEVKVIQVLTETTEIAVSHGNSLVFTIRNRADDKLIGFEAETGFWISETGFFNLIGKLMSGMVCTAVGAGTEITAIGND